MENRWKICKNFSDSKSLKNSKGISNPVKQAVCEVHYKLIEDAETHPPYPKFKCPAHIIHGWRDEVISVDICNELIKFNPQVKYVEVDDDHLLNESVPTISEQVDTFLIGGKE